MWVNMSIFAVHNENRSKMNELFHSRRYWAVLITAAVGVALLFTTCGRKQWRTAVGEVWTTEYHITYESRCALDDSISAVLRAVDASASPYNKESVVTAVNDNRSDRIDALLKRLLDVSAEVNKASGGLYDPTVMPLVDAWGFGKKGARQPSQAEIDSLLRFVGMSKVRVDGDRIVKADPRVSLDFSSVAKGLAVDEVGRMLERNGVERYLVEIGGEVVSRGMNPDGKPWHVSVDLPAVEQDTVVHASALVIAPGACGVATSGNYRKWAESGGKHISHIINPLTGSSEVSDLLSVTVVARSCMLADAWSTACMAMGTDRTRQLMETRQDLGVLTLSTDSLGRIVAWSNRRFADLVVE